VCSFQQGLLIDLGNDHDAFGEASEGAEARTSSVPASDLLSIDQLLETVWPLFKKSVLPCFSLVYLSLGYGHAEMALLYNSCSLGMIIFVL
jgi:hypothetical protein